MKWALHPPYWEGRNARIIQVGAFQNDNVAILFRSCTLSSSSSVRVRRPVYAIASVSTSLSVESRDRNISGKNGIHELHRIVRAEADFGVRLYADHALSLNKQTKTNKQMRTKTYHRPSVPHRWITTEAQMCGSGVNRMGSMEMSSVVAFDFSVITFMRCVLQSWLLVTLA